MSISLLSLNYSAASLTTTNYLSFITSGSNVTLSTTSPPNIGVTGHTSGVTITMPPVSRQAFPYTITNLLGGTGNTLTSKSIYITSQTPDFTTWATRQPNSNIHSWRNITWSPQLGIFCAVATTGTGGRVMTSTDGIAWTTIQSPLLVWNSITWAAELGLFCAVAQSGTGSRVMTSPDGITWITQASPSGQVWSDVTWSPDLRLFCAVSNVGGSGNRIMTSSDGITWTTQVPGTNFLNNRSVSWSPELGIFCVVASGLTTGGTEGSRVQTSPDGINWTTRSSPTEFAWHDVTWSSELNIFCAVAVGSGGGRVMTSPDGLTWTTRNHPTGQSWVSVTWSPQLSLFCAVAEAPVAVGGNRIMTSSDGINWTTQVPANNFMNNTAITWSPELGVFCITASGLSAGGTGTSRVQTNVISSNTNCLGRLLPGDKCSILPITLNKSYAPTNSFTSFERKIYNPIPRWVTSSTSDALPAGHAFNDIVWSCEKGLFVTTSRSGAVATSLDGITWTSRTPTDTRDWNALAFSPRLNLFCAAAYGVSTTGNIMTSSDGITWTSSSTPILNNVDMCWSPDLNLFCAVGDNSIATSTDGTTWTSRVAFGTNYSSVCWSSELNIFIALSSNNTTGSYSSNGTTWTTLNSATPCTTVCWSPELGLLVGGGTDLMTTSVNGTSWLTRTAPSGTFYNMVWAKEPGYFVTQNTGGTLLAYSNNGTTWNSTSSTTGTYSLCWSPELNQFITVGANYAGRTV